ncbi:hypothetical protein DIURU_002611 [Diutina rugosa]|uniref:Glutamine-dependent NAD(+) synthetase n=1 Tax=Diutina rugosa TaxID=5481 RepID=A0A642UPI7_DIURU|nr:uncharacterized protein DIURU_002611 [Diutina rugosa]KAA8903010.1 hypothetical protein DIURU_002611 [Diutina rugosa]
MGRFTTIATCNLNQWALDFEGNRDRIVESIRQAKAAGAQLRVGPELEVCGYGCLDHFAETELYDNCWIMYEEILANKETHGILLDIGMPVIHNSIKYNCRLISYDGKILLIRPKLYLANDGNYREMRYFTPWCKPKYWETYQLPDSVARLTGDHSVPIGDCIINTADTRIGCETCEELFTPQSPHISMALAGVEIFTNSSGSHHELRKLITRLELITEATKKCGGVYLYANQRGCDGDRLYYDGSACIIINGDVVGQGHSFSIDDIEVVTATVDLDEVRAYRHQISSNYQSARVADDPYHTIDAFNVYMCPSAHEFDPMVTPSNRRKAVIPEPAVEIAKGPACWLWDYLRRSKTGGFFLPLSGGLDSCSTAVIVHSMCRMVYDAIKAGNKQALQDVRDLTRIEDFTPDSPQAIAKELFYTSYMGTQNSSKETRERAKQLASDIGSYHIDIDIDTIVSSVVSLFEVATGKRPVFKVFGGSSTENLALQNIQARLRMVMSYLFAQLLPWTRSKPSGLLVLGSANVDECLRGYLTKYDCSSADINPIGGVSKNDLKKFISWAETALELPILRQFLDATPTAELEPTTDTYVQSDEADMGMTYDELSAFGRLRKVEKCGPTSMFIKLYHQWSQPPYNLSARQIAEKVQRFFFFYAVNRHKMTTITPSYHAEAYSPDDNRFDLRPILVNPYFPLARKRIAKLVDEIESRHTEFERALNSVE